LDFTVHSVDVNERNQLEQCHMWDDAGITTNWTLGYRQSKIQ